MNILAVFIIAFAFELSFEITNKIIKNKRCNANDNI